MKTLSLLTLLLALIGSSWAAETNKPTAVEIETWRQKIIHTPQPKIGCFTANYPETAWREVPCSNEPTKIRLPKRGGGLRPAIVGNGVDFVAQSMAHISEAEGSFDSASGVTSETQTYTDYSTMPPTVTVTPNFYGFQLNTEYFNTSVCSTSPYLGPAWVGTPYEASCRGWEQFLLSSIGGAGIQYWINNYGPPGTVCPAPHHAGCAPGASYSDGWCEFQFTPSDPVQCVVNGPGMHALPASVGWATPLDITLASHVRLMGRVAGVGGSATDAAIVTYDAMVSTVPGVNMFPDLGTQWQYAEFNLFGSCCGLQADLNPGATMVVRVEVTDGTPGPPVCNVGGFTGETNNMTLVDLPGPAMHTGTPSLVFMETNNGSTAMPSCSMAITMGDTHITTFDGAYYDFQAYGDFLLADDGGKFVVQARQASGAPTWPNAAVNKAIATRMGSTRVVIYIEPTRLYIDGAPTALADGNTILRPTGVQISRAGNVYSISDEHGNSVQAELNSTWINVGVGLGHSPSAVRGLLGNPRGNGQELFTADGVVLKAPVLFSDLYKVYAESWRVSPKESLFTGETKSGVPTKIFYARDLTKEQSARALAACKAAGVKNPALLDACTLDTTVLNDKAAVKAFVKAPAPRYVIKPVATRGKQDRD